FSFNSPYGACTTCSGLGTVLKLVIAKIIRDPKKSIKQGAIEPLKDSKNTWIYKQIEQIGKNHGFSLTTPVEDIPEDGLKAILYGSEEIVKNEDSEGMHTTRVQFEGIAQFIQRQLEEENSAPLARWALSFMERKSCDDCGGTRLKKEALHFRLLDKNIAQLAAMDIVVLARWMCDLEAKLGER